MRMHLFSRLAVSLVVACAMVAAGSSRALADTVTFDVGFHDPNIQYPGGVLHGPYDWIEGNIRVEGVWLFDAATAQANFQLGHLHIGTYVPAPLGSGNGDFIHGWYGDLEGLYIHFEDHRPFRLASLRHRLVDRDGVLGLPNDLPWSFANNNGQLLLAATFDPTMPFPAFEGQFQAFPIDDGTEEPGNPNSPALDSPWRDIAFNQFENVTGIYIFSTVDVIYVDDIVLEQPVRLETDVSLAGQAIAIQPGKLLRLSARPVMAGTLPGVTADPTLGGGVLRIVDTQQGSELEFALPAEGWRALGSDGARGYRYRGAGSDADPCTSVTLRESKLKVRCKGAALDFALPPQGEIFVQLELGAGGKRYCASFGGKTVKSSATSLKRRNAPAATCTPAN